MFEIVLYTASTQGYANPIIDRIDPNHCIQHRLFREHCTFYGSFPIKNLSHLGRDLKDVIIVDDMSIAYSKEPANGIPITSWKGNKEDKQLQELLPILELLARVEDVRVYLKKINRGVQMDFKKTLPILEQEIAANNKHIITGTKNTIGNTPISNINSMGGMYKPYNRFDSTEYNHYGLRMEGKYSLNNTRWKQTELNAPLNKEESVKYTPLAITLKKQATHGHLVNIPIDRNSSNVSVNKLETEIKARMGCKKPVTIMNRAYEYANMNKNYFSANPWTNSNLKNEEQGYKSKGRVRAYGVYQIPRMTYANF